MIWVSFGTKSGLQRSGRSLRGQAFNSAAAPCANSAESFDSATLRSGCPGASHSSFLYDLSVLDHGDAAALGHFALQCNRFAAILSQLIVHWLVFADDQIGFAIAHDAHGAAVLDAL